MSVEPLHLAIHHVGGRGGARYELEQALFGPLAEALTLVLYDPAADALGGMEAIGAACRARSVSLPYALGDRSGRQTLYETLDPYVSSLREPLDDPLTIWSGYDYPFARSARVLRQSSVMTYRLDELPELRDGSVPLPDILLIDTQGFEREVLSGAGKLLDNVVKVVAETPLHVLYRGAARFSEILTKLEDAGLRFATFASLHNGQPYRMPLGMRGADFMYEVDSVYMRDLAGTEDAILLAKAAVTAHLFGYHAYGFEAQRRYAERFGKSFGAGPLGALLTELHAAAERMPILRILSFDEIYSEDESKRRTDPRYANEVEREVKQRLAELGPQLVAEQRDVMVQIAGALDTPVEAVLRRFGLDRRADQLRTKRMDDAAEYLRLFKIKVVGAE